MAVRIQSPSSSESCSTRQADCVEAITRRFRELHNPGEDHVDLIKEAMASGWSMRVRLVLNKLLGADLREQDQ
jgi:hypothetical protein